MMEALFSLLVDAAEQEGLVLRGEVEGTMAWWEASDSRNLVLVWDAYGCYFYGGLVYKETVRLTEDWCNWYIEFAEKAVVSREAEEGLQGKTFIWTAGELSPEDIIRSLISFTK